MIDDILLEAEDKMDKAVDSASHEFANIRTGRATSSMFEQLMVDYYGAPTPMQQLASFQIPEARTVLISPFDRTATQEIIRRCANRTWVSTPPTTATSCAWCCPP